MIKYSLIALYLIGGLATTVFYALTLKPYEDAVKNYGLVDNLLNFRHLY